MANDLLPLVNYMAKERGIPKDALIKALEIAMESAVAKDYGSQDEFRVKIDPVTCELKGYKVLEVVDDEPMSDAEINIVDARKINPEIECGELVEVESTPDHLGRVAAQTAKQVILQKVRQAENDQTYEEYKSQEGEIITGSVKRFQRSDIIVELDKAEGIIPGKERIETEDYRIGERISGYVLSVEQGKNGSSPDILLSRTTPAFVKRLFEMESTEINEGIVKIVGIAREPGFRTKMAVMTEDPRIDPVGACVGIRGVRVRNVVDELGGEKIDIVPYSENLETYVANALAPAKGIDVKIDAENPKLAHVSVNPDQYSLAIGKQGLNVKLSAKLLRMKINITKKSDKEHDAFEKQLLDAIDKLAVVDGISAKDAGILVKAGFITVDGIAAVDISDIVELAGISQGHAESIYSSALAAITV
jgi:N utilization substance protein A